MSGAVAGAGKERPVSSVGTEAGEGDWSRGGCRIVPGAEGASGACTGAREGDQSQEGLRGLQGLLVG